SSQQREGNVGVGPILVGLTSADQEVGPPITRRWGRKSPAEPQTRTAGHGDSLRRGRTHAHMPPTGRGKDSGAARPACPRIGDQSIHGPLTWVHVVGCLVIHDAWCADN